MTNTATLKPIDYTKPLIQVNKLSAEYKGTHKSRDGRDHLVLIERDDGTEGLLRLTECGTVSATSDVPVIRNAVPMIPAPSYCIVHWLDHMDGRVKVTVIYDRERVTEFARNPFTTVLQTTEHPSETFFDPREESTCHV